MARVVDIMKTSMIAGKSPDDLMRIAVVLPDSASLIPFIHGVVSRVSQQDDPIPFNISLGYPFKRTPLFQLLMTMIRVLDSGKNGDRVYAPDYLSLIRHPYVKLSASGEGEQESLKRGIHLIEDLISRENLFHFDPDQIIERIRSLMELSDG